MIEKLATNRDKRSSSRVQLSRGDGYLRLYCSTLSWFSRATLFLLTDTVQYALCVIWLTRSAMTAYVLSAVSGDRTSGAMPSFKCRSSPIADPLPSVVLIVLAPTSPHVSAHVHAAPTGARANGSQSGVEQLRQPTVTPHRLALSLLRSLCAQWSRGRASPSEGAQIL